MFAKGRYIGWLLGALCLIGQGCSSSAVQEAEHVVAQADSLRAQGRMYGIDEGDSITLAQAYETLQKKSHLSIINYQLSSSYARACYHYGRLLREKDDPVAAMQVFINATHSRTRDYHILGRVYSNMGEIAHLAEEYSLSYDMFERSGEMFLQIGDTIAYYYALNDMAFELAQQGKKDEVLTLLSHIEKNCTEKYALSKALETKAVACLYSQQYDSAVIYAKMMIDEDNHEPTGYLVCAQSYSYAGLKDSAAHYAQIVLQKSQNLFHRNNALYILTNDAEECDKEIIRQVAADRSDVQKLIETRHGKLTQAVQLLEQDLTHKPNLAWLYAIIATLIIVSIGISIYVSNKRKKHGLLSQKMEELQHATFTIQEKHDELEERYLTNRKQIEEEINKKCSMLCSNEKIKNALAWKNYNKMCALVDTQFYLLATKLRSKECLSETEIRLCVLTLLNCGYDQMAELLYHPTTSIGTLKLRVAKKLGTTSKQLRQYLIDNECIR